MNWRFNWLCKDLVDEYIIKLAQERNRADMYQTSYVEALETIRKLRSKRKPRKRNLSSSKGFKKVTDEEAQEMYDMWKEGYSMTDIASTLNRSNSCVGTHIHKLYEKEHGNGESMERVSGQEDRTSQEEE